MKRTTAIPDSENTYIHLIQHVRIGLGVVEDLAMYVSSDGPKSVPIADLKR